MNCLIDASVVVHLLEDHAGIAKAVSAIDPIPDISALTRAELENGILRDVTNAAKRRAILDEFLTTFSILPFDDNAAAEYGRIVAALGYSRAKTIDRMLAAQAIVSGARLVTMNGDDFRTVPGLDLAVWQA